MANTATLVLKIITDAALAEQALKNNLPKAVQGTQSAFAKLAIPAGIALGAVVALGKGALDAASDAEQAAGGVEAVFKSQSRVVNAWADNSAQAVGLSTTAYKTMATILGAQLKNMGTSMDRLAPQTNDLIKLGADLAAQYGGSTSDAVEALSALLRGERDPIERYGVSIKQSTLDAYEAANGLTKLTGQAKTNADAQATLAILTQQTADAQGAFARETDTAAHAQQVANAEWSNATAAIGTALLPLVVQLSTAMGALAVWVQQNADLVRTLGIVVGVLAAAILAVNIAFQLWSAAVKVATAVQWALNAALSANPIGLVILAVIALVAAIVLLWNRSETFRRVVTQAFQAVLAVVRSVVSTIMGIFRALAPVLLLPIRIWYGLTVLMLRGIGVVVRWLVNTIIRPVWSSLTAILAGPFRTLQTVVGIVFRVVGSIIGTAVGALRSLWSTLTSLLVGPFQTFQLVVGRVFGVVGGLFRSLLGVVNTVFGAIKKVIDKIARAIDSLPQLPKINLPFGIGRSAGGGIAPAPSGLARSLAPFGLASSGGGAGGGVNIVIQGAVDPEGTARAINQLLARHRVRVGRSGPLATSLAV